MQDILNLMSEMVVRHRERLKEKSRQRYALKGKQQRRERRLEAKTFAIPPDASFARTAREDHNASEASMSEDNDDGTDASYSLPGECHIQLWASQT